MRTRRKRLAIPGALCALLAACSHTPVTHDELSAIGEAIAREGCPDPVVTVERRPNAHVTGATNELRTLECPHARIGWHIAHATRPPREFVSIVQLRQPHPRLPRSLDLGASADAVRRTLGAAIEDTPSQLVYLPGDSDAFRIAFELEAGRVRSIEWSWMID
jgi:hypothetical protein